MKIAIIGQDEKADDDSLVIRELNPRTYRIDESDTLIELVNNGELIITSVVLDSMGSNLPKAKVITKDYRYRTKTNSFLKFTQRDGKLQIEQTP